MLAPDLAPRWERTLPQRGMAVALDPFGQYLAAADGRGGLTLYDHNGKARWNAPNARPLQHLAFIPERPALAAAADFGLVACYGVAGNVLWRDAPVAHTGGAGGQRRRDGDRPRRFQRRPELLFVGGFEAARAGAGGAVPAGRGVLRRRRLSDRRPGAAPAPA